MRLHLVDLASATLADGSNSALAPRDAALLAWLALEGPTPRARLAELLWPGSEPEAARNTLRQRLFHLKKHCRELVSGGTALRLGVTVQHDLDAAAGVLGDLQFPDAPDLNRWLHDQRERRITGQRRDLEAQVRTLESAGELAAALPVAQALLQLDALSEAAHRHVMRLHYLRGDRAAALLAFDHCERTLKDEIGTRPSEETLALLRTVEQARPHTWIAGQPLPASALRPPVLIGRDRVLAELATTWAAQRVFLLTGEAGAGKSRLLDTFCEGEPGRLTLRARPGDDKVPLATIHRLVHRLRERWPAVSATAAHRRFLARMSAPREGQAPNVQSALPVVTELLAAAAAQGLVALVLDDLQFADDASFDLWQELLDRASLGGLRFGFASRLQGETAAHRLAALGGRGDVVKLPLLPLDAVDVQPFIESLHLPLVDARSVAAALTRRIGGNPLHLLETIRHALEKHGQLRADALEAPARVAELLEQRLTALPAEGLLVVRIAAVAGHEFDPELAAAVSRRDVLELADSWHALERLGLLDSRGFMHDLIGEAAQRLLPEPIARVLHGRVALHLAQRGAGPARLAHHLLSAGDEVAAIPHLAAAARQAWQLGRSREVREAYFRAASIELSRGRSDAAFDLLFDCTEAMTELGPMTGFDEALERLAPLAHSASQRVRVGFFRIVNRFERGDIDRFEPIVEETLAAAIESGDLVIEAECLFARGVHTAYAGKLREATGHLTDAADIHRRIGRESRAIDIEMSTHLVMLWAGQARPALQRQQAWLDSLSAGSSSALPMMSSRQALSQTHLGEFDAAARTARRSLEALRGTDMMAVNFVSTVQILADVHRRGARWDEAIAVVEENRQRVAEQGDTHQRLASALAEIYLDLGRPDLAHRYVEAFADAAQFARLRERALALRWAYRLATGGAIDAAAAVSSAVDSENLLVACELMLTAGTAARPEVRAAQCSVLIGRCESEGLREQLVPLYALRCWLSTLEGDAAAAAAGVAETERALDAWPIGAAFPRCTLWLAHALRAAGREAEALARVERAAAWISARAEDAVPPEFRESFLQRNPTHRTLRDWR